MSALKSYVHRPVRIKSAWLKAIYHIMVCTPTDDDDDWRHQRWQRRWCSLSVCGIETMAALASNSIWDRIVSLFVCVSVVSVRDVHPIIGGRSAMLHRNLRGEDKNPGSTNKYMKFGQLIIRQIVKILH